MVRHSLALVPNDFLGTRDLAFMHEGCTGLAVTERGRAEETVVLTPASYRAESRFGSANIQPVVVGRRPTNASVAWQLMQAPPPFVCPPPGAPPTGPPPLIGAKKSAFGWFSWAVKLGNGSAAVATCARPVS